MRRRSHRRHEILGWLLGALMVLAFLGFVALAKYAQAWLFWSAAP